jgi:hypothetical protein
MMKLAITTLTATGIAAATFATAAPTLAAPSGGLSAQDTIAQWQSEGYTVNITRIGSGPLSECAVVGVRNPNTITRTTRSHPGAGGVTTLVVSKTVDVTLNCTGAS